MHTLGRNATGFTALKSVQPRTVRLGATSLVNTGYLESAERLPFVIQPAGDYVDLLSWTRNHRDWLETQLLQHGGILFRGFQVESSEAFEAFASTISPTLLEYYERSTPRSQVAGKVYTSTDYPSEQTVPIHNECAYSYYWPMKIWFCCLQPALQGGATPLVDSQRMLTLLSPALQEQLRRKKLMYIRNYYEGLDIPWQTAFATTDKTVVEDYCRQVGMTFEWCTGNRLRTRQVREAVAQHPKTGALVWFNQAHAFHVSNLAPSVRDAMLSMFAADDLPRHVCYGDGSPMAPEVFDEIRAAYQQATIRFTWQRGDVLMLDNMLVAHGRDPYVPPRQVVVVMAESMNRDTIGGR